MLTFFYIRFRRGWSLIAKSGPAAAQAVWLCVGRQERMPDSPSVFTWSVFYTPHAWHTLDVTHHPPTNPLNTHPLVNMRLCAAAGAWGAPRLVVGSAAYAQAGVLGGAASCALAPGAPAPAMLSAKVPGSWQRMQQQLRIAPRLCCLRLRAVGAAPTPAAASLCPFAAARAPQCGPSTPS
jgi:hypothetical protein